MDCEQVKAQLGLYLDDELSADARREADAHLSVCSDCADELASLRRFTKALAADRPAKVPEALWASIEARLDHQPERQSPRIVRRPWPRLVRWPLAAAASMVLVVGLGLLGVVWFYSGEQTAEASTIDFGELLNSVQFDPRGALAEFLSRYEAREILPHQARGLAPTLDFEVPEFLPGGFRRESVHVLRFGGSPGIAAQYRRNDGEFLAALFHPPVHQEDFGTHEDYPCVIGQHRGHAVTVGSWRLVHVMDPSTCHCVLSRLDPETQLPAILTSVAPRSSPSRTDEHRD